MDLLVAIGTTAGWALSMWLWLTAEPGEMVHLYFEGSAVVVTLVLLGKWLEARQTAHHHRDPRAACAAARRGACDRQDRRREGTSGGRIAHWRPPGGAPWRAYSCRRRRRRRQQRSGRIDADWRAAAGGEGAGQQGHRRQHQRQRSAAHSCHRYGRESVLAHIIRLVEDAQTAKAPIQRLVDQVAAVFVPVVLVIALATLAGWWLTRGSFEQAVIHAVAVLVIACPCARAGDAGCHHGGHGIAARQGVLINEVQALSLPTRWTRWHSTRLAR